MNAQRPFAELRRRLEALEGKSYGAYKALRSERFEAEDLALLFASIQGDPFAAPSRLTFEVAAERAGLPAFASADAIARCACADFLQRAYSRVLNRQRSGARGSGKSGLLEMTAVGPEVLERTGVWVGPAGELKLQLFVGLPR